MIEAITIGDRKLGPGHACFVIAEAGVNHNGSLERACELIDAAARSGADAVKFQLYRVAEQVSRGTGTADYQLQQTGAQSMADMAASYELPWEAHAELAAHCQQRGIVYCASSFEPAAVDRLLELEVPFLKIASGEITNVPLLRHAGASGKPVLLSTGMSTLEDIEQAVMTLRRAGVGGLALFHCVSRYPTPPDAVNLRFMQTLASQFDVPVGFSDHTEGFEAAVASVALGASMIEKHFTLNRGLPGPDHAMSLEPAALSEFVRAIRSAEACLGSAQKLLDEDELRVARVARRSLVSARTIAAGEALGDENVVLKRPGTGIDPRDWESFRGRVATREIPADVPITPDMLS